MNYWLPNVPGWIFSVTVMALIFLINYLSVRSYGETEFWLALIKVVTVIVFLIVGVAIIFGIMGGKPVGLSNFHYKQAPFVGECQRLLAFSWLLVSHSKEQN